MKEDSKSIDLVENELRLFVESLRPPIDIRDKVDVGYTYDKGNFELFEIRPGFNDPKKSIQNPVARARYVKTQKIWKLYWMRGNLEWTLYEENGTTHKTLSKVLDLIKKDTFGCFWG